MGKSATIVITRHTDKEPDPNIPKPENMKIGGFYDKYFMRIKRESGLILQLQVSDIVGPEKQLNNVYNITSDFRRALESAHYASAGLEITSGGLTYAKPNPSLSFVANPDMDWSRKFLHELNDTEAVEYLFQNEYFTEPDNPRTMQVAMMSQKFFESVVDGISYLKTI
ncbi:MAG: hypothetical protein ABH828_04730 [archaeon]